MPQMLIEIPELLHQSFKHYLETHPEITPEELITASLCLFLLIEREGQIKRQVNRHFARAYLDMMLKDKPRPE